MQNSTSRILVLVLLFNIGQLARRHSSATINESKPHPFPQYNRSPILAFDRQKDFLPSSGYFIPPLYIGLRLQSLVLTTSTLLLSSRCAKSPKFHSGKATHPFPVCTSELHCFKFQVHRLMTKNQRGASCFEGEREHEIWPRPVHLLDMIEISKPGQGALTDSELNTGVEENRGERLGDVWGHGGRMHKQCGCGDE